MPRRRISNRKNGGTISPAHVIAMTVSCLYQLPIGAAREFRRNGAACSRWKEPCCGAFLHLNSLLDCAEVGAAADGFGFVVGEENGGGGVGWDGDGEAAVGLLPVGDDVP